MVAQPQLTQRPTPAAYLEFETQAATRHEYINGEIIPMTGGHLITTASFATCVRRSP